ncbi:hypothetical protein DL546_006967 [Coniochaeta pulveracea]|uniref:Stc1 domain-containing protein n=1 Tax=Coniochaeta pulveracea TaxID=177199 RepID=A0A420YA07_9PEZI|nr:hypothetical protein DL546_006967 [Coniochaeta pulveracea]
MPPALGSQWASRQNPAVPAKIRCDIGKEWKNSSEFSKNKLVDYANRARLGGYVTPANSGISCRVHTGEPGLKRQCMGPCGKILPLSLFSKNTRVRGINWCNECTEWQLANEPGWSPYPTPDSRTTEEDRLPNNSSTISKQAMSTTSTTGNIMWPIRVEDDEEDEDSEDDDATSVTGTETVTTTTRHALSVVSGLGGTSEYDGSQITAAMDGLDLGSDATERNYGGPAMFGGATGSSAAPTDTASVSSRQTPLDGPLMQVFNAWDPSGNYHRVAKAPTVVSEARTTTTTTTATSTSTTRENGWAKPASRKCPAEPPSYLKARQAATSDGLETSADPRHSMYYQPSRSDDGESDDDI